MGILIEDFTKAFGAVVAVRDVNLEVGDGEMLALLGPSGCGKTTTLFSISGIHRVSRGRIVLGDRDVTKLPSQARNVGIVFQSYALYPHMKVWQNIAFPLQIKKLPRAEIEREVEAMARLVHIEELLDRRPAELSGGQQQRVALARALVRKPGVLLLDEPLANLDAKLRLEMRSEIRRIQLETGIPAILVTHDQVEAMSMCDRIAIMNKGEIVQIDSPTDMYANPQTTFVAGFLGNPPIAFVEGTLENGALAIANSDLRWSLPERSLKKAQSGDVTVGIRPEHFGTDGDVPVHGRITFVETQGRENLFDVTLDNGIVLRSVQSSRQSARVGDEVDWFIEKESILVFDQDGQRI